MGMPEGLRIVDAHAHIIEAIKSMGYRGELRALGDGRARWATGEGIQIFPPALGDRSFTPEKLLETMDAAGVAKAILLQGSLYGFQNEYSHEAALRYPDRFACLGSFDPYCLKADVIMRRWIEEFRFKGLKFEMSTYGGFMGFHPDFKIDGPLMAPIWSYANQRGLVVSLDIGTFGDPSFQLDGILAMVKAHPDVTLVIEHMFCPSAKCLEMVTGCLQRIAPFSKIHVTLASIPSMTAPEAYPYRTAQEYARTAREVIGAERIMWGSDAPITLVGESYSRLVGYLPESGIFGEDELRLIFSENARRVYSLSL